jgi:hypothetical protein
VSARRPCRSICQLVFHRILWIVGGLVSLAGMWTFVVWGTVRYPHLNRVGQLTVPAGYTQERRRSELPHLPLSPTSVPGRLHVRQQGYYPRSAFSFSPVSLSLTALHIGSAPGNAVIFGEYVLRAAHQDSPGQWTRRLVGFAALTFGFLLHGINLRWGLHAQNFLGVFKIFVLAIIVLSGGLALGGYLPGPRPDNFHHIFEGTTASASSISLSLYKVALRARWSWHRS